MLEKTKSNAANDDNIQQGSHSVFGPERLCFVLTPFGCGPLNVLYEFFLRPAIEESGLKCLRADEERGARPIIADILKRIRQATLIVADLTDRNANVLYEVGHAHALKKPVLLLAQKIETVPFDLRHRRILLYDFSPAGLRELQRNLPAHIREMLSPVRQAS